MAATLCRWNDRLTHRLFFYLKKWVLSLPPKRGYKFIIAWMLSVSCSTMITRSDVPYSNSDSDALCLVPGARRCSAVNVKSYVPYFPSGRSALCVVRDAYRYSAVVVESYLPYFPSGRNALRVVRDANRCCAVVVVTQFTFVLKKKSATDAAVAPSSGNASAKAPEACATLKSRLKTYRRCPKTSSQLDAKAGAAVC